MENCDHRNGSVLSILFLDNPVYNPWLFEKLIFELEPSYSFILVKQVIFLKKYGCVIGKIYF